MNQSNLTKAVQRQENILEAAQTTTLVLGLGMFYYFFYQGAQLTMADPQKETMAVGAIFSLLVSLFSIISIITNNNKN